MDDAFPLERDAGAFRMEGAVVEVPGFVLAASAPSEGGAPHALHILLGHPDPEATQTLAGHENADARRCAGRRGGESQRHEERR